MYSLKSSKCLFQGGNHQENNLPKNKTSERNEKNDWPKRESKLWRLNTTERIARKLHQVYSNIDENNNNKPIGLQSGNWE